jgi:hypothetical protein
MPPSSPFGVPVDPLVKKTYAGAVARGLGSTAAGNPSAVCVAATMSTAGGASLQSASTLPPFKQASKQTKKKKRKRKERKGEEKKVKMRGNKKRGGGRREGGERG